MPLPLSGKFLIADVAEIQKKFVITYAIFSLITITRKLRRNYGCRNYGFHYAGTLVPSTVNSSIVAHVPPQLLHFAWHFGRFGPIKTLQTTSETTIGT